MEKQPVVECWTGSVFRSVTMTLEAYFAPYRANIIGIKSRNRDAIVDWNIPQKKMLGN
jgi:hypothetical protein